MTRSLLVPLIAFSSLALTACQSTTGCLHNDTSCFTHTKSILPFAEDSGSPTLNAQFEYIKLTLNGKTVWLAKGATDTWDGQNAQVYYSADRSIFRWSKGRLVAVTMPSLDWREHLSTPMAWNDPARWQFTRVIDNTDVTLGMTEHRTLEKVTAPAHHHFTGNSAGLIWLHEYTQPNPAQPATLPSFDSWYAFSADNLQQPIYGQQCISPKYCLTWQVWKPYQK